MSRHSKGPWSVSRVRIQSSDGKVVATCDVWGPDWSTKKANADLIAAAPDLLEACEALIAWVDALPVKHPQQSAFKKKARAAIARATGAAS